MSLTILDSRRLTGPNLLSSLPGAFMDVEVSGHSVEEVVNTWEEQVKILLDSVGWGGQNTFTRIFKNGASLAFSAPVDALYAATELNEAAFERASEILSEEKPGDLETKISELRQTIISGQGELHLEIVVRRLREKFGVDVNLVEPKIAYRETIRGNAETQGKYKKQSGGRGQYGDVWLRVEPVERGGGFEFVDAIVGGVIPTKYIPAVEKGIKQAMEEGIISRHRVVDIKVTLYDGSYHNVDSSDMAFKIAGSMAFKKAFQNANPIMLEPIFEVEVVVPEEFMGDVMGDLSSRRGKISGMDSEGPFQVIKANVPLAELYKYSTALRSLSQGRGIHRRKFSHYDPVPTDITQKLAAAAQEAKSK